VFAPGSGVPGAAMMGGGGANVIIHRQ
jgi:hypothetical protein